mmetsp:Transcript_45113/g.119731  ORF Transcript_45113/g.119731 Transcript_45113/m.119731 type:complete len:207 (-) Transcript_45113:740-1360(-)
MRLSTQLVHPFGVRKILTTSQRTAEETVRASAEDATLPHLRTLPKDRRQRVPARLFLVVLSWRWRGLDGHLVAVAIVSRVERLPWTLRVLKSHHNHRVMHSINLLLHAKNLLHVVLELLHSNVTFTFGVHPWPWDVHVVWLSVGHVQRTRPTDAIRGSAELCRARQSRASTLGYHGTLLKFADRFVLTRPRQRPIPQELLVRERSP